MTTSFTNPGGAAVTVEGVAAALPAALIAAVVARQGLAGSEPVSVDASGLRIHVPPAAVTAALRALLPGRTVDVAFEPGAVIARADGLPPIRLTLPTGSLRVDVGADGVTISG